MLFRNAAADLLVYLVESDQDALVRTPSYLAPRELGWTEEGMQAITLVGPPTRNNPRMLWRQLRVDGAGVERPRTRHFSPEGFG